MNTGRSIASGSTTETVSTEELYQVMTGAASQDPALCQASSARFKQMLDMFGIYDGLHEIAASRAVPLPVRQQSIIQFKNAAINHWRSRKLLSDEQRTRIRARCLTFLDEEDDIIAQCNEVIVARIARQDYPNNWPDLVEQIMTTIDTHLQTHLTSSDDNPRRSLILRRSLKLLNGIVKEFSAYKMLNGVRTMTVIVEKYHLALYEYYSRLSTCFNTITASNIGSQQTITNVLLSHLVYKSLTKIAVWLWNRTERTGKEELEKNIDWLTEFFANSSNQVRVLTELRRNIMANFSATGLAADPQARRTVDVLTRHIRHFGKFFRKLQQRSQPRFVALPMCGDLIMFYWNEVVQATSGPPNLIADTNDAVFPVRFLVQGMVLFKENLAQWKPVRKDGTPNQTFLSREFVEGAVGMLITRFMPLNPTDLEGWMADPEEWANVEDTENDQWEFELRPCSERVLMQLCNQYSEFVIPLLAQTFNQVAAQPSVDLPSVIQKEALYCALGRCASRLKGKIPFNEWLETTLASEARDPNPNYPIIKRRIAWLLGKWVADSGTSPNNPKLWEILIHLLGDRGPGTDAVVRLTAAVAVRECIDVLEFDADKFGPFLPTTMTELVRLLGEADTFQSKRRINQSLIAVIQQMGLRIIPFKDMITQPLPELWTAAGEDWLFKASLLVTVNKLIESIKEESTALGGLVVPLLRESLTPGVMSHLDEDVLDLWITALRNTVMIQSVNGAPALIDLFPEVISLLATNLDLLGKIVTVVESYFFLDGPAILQSHAIALFNAYCSALKSNAVTLNMKDMLISLNLLMQNAPSSLWGEAMHFSGLFWLVLDKLVDGESGPVLLTEYILLLARMVMSDPQMFLQLMAITASSKGVAESFLYNHLLDQWWGKWDNMSEPRHRKLSAMGIAALVSTGRPEVLSRLPDEIFNIWTDVFAELKEVRLNAEPTEVGISPPVVSPLNLRRHWELDEAPHHYYQNTESTPEYDRRKAVYDRDPVRTQSLAAYVGAYLRQAEAVCGPQAFQMTYLSKADPAVLKQIQDELARA